MSLRQNKIAAANFMKSGSPVYVGFSEIFCIPKVRLCQGPKAIRHRYRHIVLTHQRRELVPESQVNRCLSPLSFFQRWVKFDFSLFNSFAKLGLRENHKELSNI